MKNKILLSTILLASLVAMPSAFSATTAEQPVTGNLSTVRAVVNNGGNLTAIIDPTTGALNTAITPGFKITTNSSSSQSLRLSAACEGGSTQNAIYNRGGTRFIILANSTVPPTNAAIADCKAAAPVAAANANAISWPVNEPANNPGELVYAYNAGFALWDANLTHKTDTLTNLTIPAVGPFVGTFSTDDLDGSYLATVTLSFNED